MQYLFDSSINNGGKCLVTAQDVSQNVNYKKQIQEGEVDESIKNLVLDGYVDVVYSDKKGQTVYCVTLLEKGQAFVREQQNTKKNITILVVRTVLLAVLSFIVGLVLKAIFT